MLFHNIEKETIWVLLDYVDAHPEDRVVLEFPEGESYICEFVTAYESDNSWEIDEEVETEEDEFLALAYQVDEVVKPGARKLKKGDGIEVSYRDFPCCVKTADGLQIYPVE